MTFCQKNAYNDELVVHYEGPKEEPIPPELDLGDVCPIKFSPFDYFCLPIRCLCIGSMLDLDVFVTCFIMLSLCFNYYDPCEHQ